MVSDPSGAFVAGARVTLNNLGNGTKQTTTTNDQGQYSFPVVPVGRYELEVSSPGFEPYKKIGVMIDIKSALQIDATLQIGQNTQTVEVNDSVVTIQMSDTEIGETINSQHVAEVPLNGRSYTDLLATQAEYLPSRPAALPTAVLEEVSERSPWRATRIPANSPLVLQGKLPTLPIIATLVLLR
jgi:hypothetical protein